MIQEMEVMLNERVFDNVRRSVGGGKSYRDDEARCDKAQKHKHEHLSFPARKELF